MAKKEKTGLYALGLVVNKNSYIDELQKKLIGTTQIVSLEDLNQMTSNVEYYNGGGYTKYPNGDAVMENTAKYLRFETDYKTSEGEIIYGCFSKSGVGFRGVDWLSEKQFKSMIKRNNSFNIGCMYFENFEDGLSFLEDIAINTIPETWKYKNKPSSINHPILKSYLENVLERLKRESQEDSEKIIYSEDKRYVMFNTNLLDKYFHDVIVYGEVELEDGDLNIKNPSRSKNQSALRKLGFGKKMPKQPVFFDDINDVIFQMEWEIDKDFDTFTHIIQERVERFPEEYKEQETDVLARKLDDAIDFAVALAQRNYKFIVPMYRPQTNSIQLLMPIYLNGAYSKHPDFALILTPDKDTEMYLPETILPLDAVYQNARLIAKPDELWLNPETIK